MKTLLLASLVLVSACGAKEEPAPPPAAAPAAAKTTEQPAAPAYSPEVAAKLTAEMAACEYDFKCPAYKTLVSFGAKAAPELVKLAADPAKPAKGRAVAAQALAVIKDPASGKPLFDAARAEKEFMLRGDLYKAAGASGADAVFAEATALYLTDEGWDTRTEIRKAIEPFGPKVLAWGIVEMAKHKQDHFESAIADLIVAVAGPADVAKLKELVAQAKPGGFAQVRLATKLVQLGDPTQIDVVVNALAVGDSYERSDAANHLAEVADKIPADQKAKVIELVKDAKAKDKGGLTSRGYDTLLKKLGAS